jgi:hypothetical protein
MRAGQSVAELVELGPLHVFRKHCVAAAIAIFAKAPAWHRSTVRGRA